MAKSFRQILKGILLRGETSDPSDNLAGSIWHNSTSGRLKAYVESAVRVLVSENQTQTLTNKTLSGNTASNLVNGSGTLNINSTGTITVPNATDTLVGKDTTDTLTNKTIDGDNNTVQDLALSSLKTNITDASKFIVRDGSGIVVSNTKAVPSGVVVGDTDTQTLSNKTLTSPVINTPTGITKSDVGLGNVDNTSDATKNAAAVTLTNKTIDGDDNTISDLALTSLKTVLADASKFLVRDASGIPVSNTKDVPTGAVVGTSDTQTLSAKTFSDAPILAEIATPSTPSSGYGKIYFKSDGFLYQLNDDGTETKVGSGAGGINYITNSDLESNVTGYSAYADAAGVAPVDGTGGSPTVTATRSTSSPLRGTASLLLTKDAANRQGEGISYDFTIATADKAKVLQGSFEYAISSGTFADNDVRMYIYDVTNAALIYPTPYLLKNHTLAAEKFNFEFQTSSSSTSYRLIFHVASTSASAYTLKFDTISVGPQAKLYGSPITDWVSYTPTLSTGARNGSPTYDKAMWRRVGDSMEIRWDYKHTSAGTAGSGDYTFTIPSGYTIDTSKMSISGSGGGVGNVCGVFNHNYSSNQGSGVSVVISSTTIGAYTDIDANSSAVVWNPANTGSFGATSLSFSITALIPITGWSSQVIMSNDADTRVVSAFYNGTQTGSLGASYNTVTFGTKVFDTHNAYSSGTYTVPISGYYDISAQCEIDGSTKTYVLMALHVNGTLKVASGWRGASFSSTVLAPINLKAYYLNAGDLVTIKTNSDGSGLTFSTSFANDAYFSIARVSGPSQIAASEIVEAHYSTSAGQSIETGTTGEILDFGTRITDSHGAVTTGGSWKFTAPKSATYTVKASSNLASGGSFSAGEFMFLQLYKNGVAGEFIGISFQQATHTTNVYCNGSTEIKLVAGDYIQVFVAQNSGGTVALQADANQNYISIISNQ